VASSNLLCYVVSNELLPQVAISDLPEVCLGSGDEPQNI
jgi:hypothetical protein